MCNCFLFLWIKSFCKIVLKSLVWKLYFWWLSMVRSIVSFWIMEVLWRHDETIVKYCAMSKSPENIKQNPLKWTSSVTDYMYIYFWCDNICINSQIHPIVCKTTLGNNEVLKPFIRNGRLLSRIGPSCPFIECYLIQTSRTRGKSNSSLMILFEGSCGLLKWTKTNITIEVLFTHLYVLCLVWSIREKITKFTKSFPS